MSLLRMSWPPTRFRIRLHTSISPSSASVSYPNVATTMVMGISDASAVWAFTDGIGQRIIRVLFQWAQSYRCWSGATRNAGASSARRRVVNINDERPGDSSRNVAMLRQRSD